MILVPIGDGIDILLTYVEYHTRSFHIFHRKGPMCVKHGNDVAQIQSHRLRQVDGQHLLDYLDYKI